MHDGALPLDIACARPSRPRAILFDWDNTLVDNWAAIHEALNAAFAAFDRPLWTLSQTRMRVRASLRDSFPTMFGDRWRDAERIFLERFAEMHLAGLHELPGATRMLAAAVAKGLYLGVVSNKHGHFLRSEADRLGWTAMFGRLVGAGDAARDKPAVEPIDLALQGSGIGRGADVWFVGDADIDMICAVNAGCIPILLRGGMPAPDEFPSGPPAGWVADCTALRRWLDER